MLKMPQILLHHLVPMVSHSSIASIYFHVMFGYTSAP